MCGFVLDLWGFLVIITVTGSRKPRRALSFACHGVCKVKEAEDFVFVSGVR